MGFSTFPARDKHNSRPSGCLADKFSCLVKWVQMRTAHIAARTARTAAVSAATRAGNGKSEGASIV